MSVAYICSTNPYNYVLYLRSTLYCAESLCYEMLQLFTVALSWAASPSSLSSLVTVLPGALDDHMGVVLPGLLFFLM